MNTTLHSFMDIFDTTFSDGAEAVKLQKITIPIIQRDYAQGRRDPDIDRVRSRFLDSLYRAVSDEPITLDFVYGDIDENGVNHRPHVSIVMNLTKPTPSKPALLTLGEIETFLHEFGHALADLYPKALAASGPHFPVPRELLAVSGFPGGIRVAVSCMIAQGIRIVVMGVSEDYDGIPVLLFLAGLT